MDIIIFKRLHSFFEPNSFRRGVRIAVVAAKVFIGGLERRVRPLRRRGRDDPKQRAECCKDRLASAAHQVNNDLLLGAERLLGRWSVAAHGRGGQAELVAAVPKRHNRGRFLTCLRLRGNSEPPRQRRAVCRRTKNMSTLWGNGSRAGHTHTHTDRPRPRYCNNDLNITSESTAFFPEAEAARRNTAEAFRASWRNNSILGVAVAIML